MRARAVAWGTLLTRLAGGASRKGEPAAKPEQPVAKVFDVRDQDKRAAADGEAEKCEHVWEQRGIHPYQVMREGLLNTELCVISRCAKCGAVLHECQTRGRRRR